MSLTELLLIVIAALLAMQTPGLEAFLTGGPFMRLLVVVVIVVVVVVLLRLVPRRSG